MDNSQYILPLLNFSDEDLYYLIEIIQRKKDGNETGAESILIKKYRFNSKEGFDKIYTEMVTICDALNARAYIRINRRSYRKTALQGNVKLSKYLEQGVYKAAPYCFGKAEGKGIAEPRNTQRIVIDIDTYEDLLRLEEYFKYSDFLKIPTVHGTHMIVHIFNQERLKKNFPKIQFGNNLPTLLYASKKIK